MKNNNQYKDNNLEYKNKKSPAYKKAASFSKGFLWGAAIGSILGILFAPDKGENTRNKGRNGLVRKNNWIYKKY